MKVTPVKFTASGQIGAAAFTGTVISPLTNAAFQPAYTDSSSVSVPAEPKYLVGLAFKGFTAVTVYNGTDNTGDPVIVATAPGTIALSYEVNCAKGLYVEATGTGSGTVWLV